MTLLYLVKHFPSLSQTFVLNEVRELTRRGHAVHVVSAIDPRDPIALDPILASRVSYLRHGSLYRYDGRPAGGEALRLDVAHVLALVRREGVTHVHADFAEDNVRLAFLVHQAAGVPFTFKMRAYDIFAEPQPDLALWAAAAARVITITRYNREYISRTWNIAPERIAVIYDGIDARQAAPIARYHHRPFRMLAASRLVEKKGFSILLDACGLLLKEQLDFHCHIIGDGPMMEPLRAHAGALGLSAHITFHGSRPHEDVLAAFESTSAFVLPSVVAANGDRDATPNVLLEAMGRGVPIVSTRLSGIPEIVRDGVDGLLVPSGDAAALADAVRTIAGNAGLADSLRSHARESVTSRFTIARTVDEFLAVLAVDGRAPVGGPALAPAGGRS